MLSRSTRSSRLFVVLLHLVGVSTNVPMSTPFASSEGSGVHTWKMVLEILDPALLSDRIKLDLDSSGTPPSNLGDTTDREKHNSGVERAPQHRQSLFWLQDPTDKSCLDPRAHFSQCGDATLWRILPKKATKRQAKWRRWITWATEEQETEQNTSDSRIEGYAIQLVDGYDLPFSAPGEPHLTALHEPYFRDNQHTPTNYLYTYSSLYQNYHHPSSPSNDWSKKECLTRRRNDNKLVLAPCSESRAWSWHFTDHGILQFEKPKIIYPFRKSHPSPSMQQKKLLKHHNARPKRVLQCLGRNAFDHAVLLPCDGESTTPTNNLSIKRSDSHSLAEAQRVLQMVLVRQAAVHRMPVLSEDSSMAQQEHHLSQLMGAPHTSLPEEDLMHQHGLPPSRRDIAHSHATDPPGSRDLRTANRVMSLSHHYQSQTPAQLSLTTSSRTTISSTSSTASSQSETKAPTAKAKSTIQSSFPRTDNNRTTVSKTTPVMKKSSTPTSKPPSSSSHKHKLQIQVNPYVAKSQNELWTDPKTGLVFHTDLCQYLGHDRSLVGRHTLTGVGQYTRTVFNVKVYGVAFYVSKRDVLVDPLMKQYAGLTAEELAQYPEFYEALRRMASTTNKGVNAASFDRTLFLKTNMQIATETMRSSLDADWKMLTQEAKDALIGSSMQSRQASEKMMKFIQSPDNPSRCSCAQLAPEGYDFDPECCARGTELAFTWRKNGNLEVRLNGELMDTFERPDMAEAIFFEYLRTDVPMSQDFLDRLVDGFPMLLEPLAQVKGVNSPSKTQPTTMGKPPTNPRNKNVVFRALSVVSTNIWTGATGVASFVRNGAVDFGKGTVNAARSMGDAARNVGEEVDRRRRLIMKHVNQFAHHAISTLYNNKRKKAVSAYPRWSDATSLGSPLHVSNWPPIIALDMPPNTLHGLQDSNSAPDEIDPMIYPPAHTTQQVFLGIVHMYLLLMLIVSFPAHFSKRIVTRKTKLTKQTSAQLVSDSEDSDEGSTTEFDES